jgi:hypothetical protein
MSKKNKSNAWAARKASSDSEDSMPDAPARFVIDSDIEMQDDSFAAQGRHSRRSSMASTRSHASMRSAYSSGKELAVPASEIESEGAPDAALEAEVSRPKKKKVSVNLNRLWFH